MRPVRTLISEHLTPPLLAVMDGFDENDPIMQEQQRKDELRTAAVLVKAAIEDMTKNRQVRPIFFTCL